MQRNEGDKPARFPARRGRWRRARCVLGGCDALSQAPWFRQILFSAERLTSRAQRALLGRSDLAREFTEADLSPDFQRERQHVARRSGLSRRWPQNGFADWRLKVDGLVEDAGRILARRAPRHAVAHPDHPPRLRGGLELHRQVEGRAARHVLEQVRLKPEARYLVFHCADALEKTLDGSGQYYESIGLDDAFHPQTILAYDMNDQMLPIAHGAPLRLRVERQLGYKMAKYVMRIEAVESFADARRRQRRLWEDRGYEWYAGI